MESSKSSASSALQERVLRWTARIPERQLMIVLALLIGFFASVAAFVLHEFIHLISSLLTSRFSASSANWLYLVFPVIGIWLTMLFVRYVVKDNISHGITRILYAISSKKSRLRGHNCWTSVIASAITIGFGGSVGAEAPIVLTGSAIGSNLGQFFRFDNKKLMLLVGSGAAAAIAGIFKAPMAGLVFTFEVLMVDLSMASLLPILTASVTATCFTYIFMGSDALFAINLDTEWQLSALLPAILLGVACGLVSLYFIRMMDVCEGVFSKLKNQRYVRLALGGTLLSLLIFLFPALYGEGYGALNILLNGESETDWNQMLNNSLFYGHGNMLLWYVALVLLTKVIATSATNGSGGVGGTFAPSLFVGGFSGFLFSRLWNVNEVGPLVSERSFTLLGMAGVMAGVMHAPLTGIFLIAEITGGYALFIPLIVVSVAVVITISLFEPHSIYAIRLARQGKLVTHHVDQSVLTLMTLDSIIEREYTAVQPDMPLGRLIHVISQSRGDFIPVVDAANHLLGEIDVTRMRHVMFRTELYSRFTVSDVMTDVSATLTTADPMTDVMQKFETTNANNLPVVDVDGTLKGYISRARTYNMYRKTVADYSAE
ncbi:MAG: chloride channel protein [Prevotella sp.]|nr:chloride channel protein [Prevotella sp.]